MRTVVIAGTGATVAEAKGQGCQNAVCPPLETTFFDVCRSLVALRKLRKTEMDTVDSYLRDRLKPVEPASASLGMERVFNLFFEDRFPKPKCRAIIPAYWALLRIYYGAINATTNELEPTTDLGLYGLLGGLLRRDSSADVVVVTFNHDLMAEKALQRLNDEQKLSVWNIREAYGPARLRFVSGRKPFTICRAPSLRILKLHGSLNWFFKVPSRKDPANAVAQPPGTLICVNHRKARTSWKLRRSDLVPVVLPPVSKKSGPYRDLLEPLWRVAEAEIGQAQRLIVFGYSFPPADDAAREMIQRAVCKAGDLQELSVIDISRCPRDKLERLTVRAVRGPYENVPAFFADGR